MIVEEGWAESSTKDYKEVQKDGKCSAGINPDIFPTGALINKLRDIHAHQHKHCDEKKGKMKFE